MSKIIVTSPGTSEESYPCTEGTITIGRLENNAIVLPAPSVSRHHATLLVEERDVLFFDTGSENGTALNGTLLRPQERYLLRENDTITIGPYSLKFSRVDERLEQSFNDITDSEIMEVKLLKKVLGALDKETLPSIEVLNGTAEGKKIFITDDLDTFVVGRDPMVDFPIEEYVVSRRHAKLLRRPEGVVVQDLGSKNGTHVNNSRVTEQLLHDGDRVAFGTIVCIYRNPRDVNLQAVGAHMKAHRKRAVAKKPPPPPPADIAASTAAEDDAEMPDITGSEVEQLTDDSALAAREKAHEYPTPRPRSTRIPFSPFEIGLIWLGTVVFLTTTVLLVKLFS